jgi:DNA-directed RNA polymerase subunit RPC12/RpoP
MPKIYTQTARKEYKCGKCGAPILPGETYKKLMGRFIQTRFACQNCKFKRSETTSSEYLSQLWALQDDFVIDGEESVESLISELETLRDEQQDKLDNMPEGLQEGDTGQLIQERLDSVDDAINTLESLEWPDEEEARKEIEEEYADDDEDEDEEETSEEESKDAFERLVADRMQELTDEVVEEAQEALGYIE